MLRNSRFLRALRREPVDATPIWVMRQAGRYLPEYRATRQRAGDFLTLCKTPELACEVTLQPLARFPLDAAIVFSDILTIPDAMGLGLSLVEGVGPRFAHPLRSAQDIHRLGIPDPEDDLSYVGNAIRLIKRELGDKVPLIGFCGSPWTLATYMIEGGSGHDFKLIKQMLYDEPELLHELLDLLAKASSIYLKAQISAGADAVMIFDTWGGILSSAAYHSFSLPYMKHIVDEVNHAVPTIAFTKGGGLWLETIADIGCSALGLDWSTDVGDARRRVGDRVALQGNLDPAILRAKPSAIIEQASSILNSFGAHPGHIFNLGHGITPDIDPENVAILVDAVHAASASILKPAAPSQG
ncbi:MAG: uroporphyrinogen decarboxylase [Gammaproteobacteria bacterium]|jgi:uroporphyrinogen decarboxylase